jgi:uncharacterized damage-inducible protein DinB
MKKHFERMLAYNIWANKTVFQALTDQNGSEEMWAKLSHVVVAEQLWQSRLSGIPYSGPGVFDLVEPLLLQDLMEKNARAWAQLLETETDLSKSYDYRLLNGTESRSVLSDILTHIFNHGSYHRGQIATLMRQEGLQPAVTDFIAFARLHPGN